MWYSIGVEHRKNLFQSDAGWSTLDQLLTSQTFVFLRKIILHLGIEFSGVGCYAPIANHIVQLERKLTLDVDNLFPLFRALKRTVEPHLNFTFL
jgi:hypothetical protein